MFTEKNVDAMLTQEGARDLFGHVEELDMAANAALQAMLLVSAM